MIDDMEIVRRLVEDANFRRTCLMAQDLYGTKCEHNPKHELSGLDFPNPDDADL
jgi:hypothetical protein